MIFFDLETTNLDHGSALNPSNRVVMVSWAVDDGPVKCYHGDILDAAEFWKDYHAQDHVCAYNAKFEQHWLRRLRVDIHDKQWHDPMLAEYVLLGNQRPGLSLNKVARRYGQDTKDSYIDTLMQAGVCPSEMPVDRLRARNKRDVRVMREIYRQQRRLLAERKQLAVYRTRVALTPVLTEIEAAGMQLDPDRVRQEYDSYVGRKVELERALDQLTGGINLRSSDQLAEFLYEKLGFPERKDARGKYVRNKPSKRWPNGKPKTDKNTLAWLAGQAKTEQQKKFIRLRAEYGKVNAALSKNLEFFQGVCQHYNCVFRAVLNQAVTATHRLSSSGLQIEIPGLGWRGVQFQNMPREFKRLFTAPPGYYIVEADFPQLEFRTAAFLGQDAQALRDISDPSFDAHVKSASVMRELDYDNLFECYKRGDRAAKAVRQDAKPDTFKPLYGGTKGTPAQERWYKEFQSRYSGIYSTQEGWLADVQASPSGELVTPWGMRFRWNFKTNRHGTPIDPATGKPIGPAVFNYPVQSLATAEIVPIALICLFRRVRQAGLDVTFVNSIHDSVVCIVKKAHLAEFNALVMQCFTESVYLYLWREYGLEFRVPLGVEITWGTHWGEGESLKYDDVTEGGHLDWSRE